MPDDKNNHGAQDHARVAAAQPHEVAYFAQKIIEANGPSLRACDAAASRSGR